MRITPPLNCVRFALLTLTVSLCTANAATYSLDLLSEVHPGKYLATPDAGLAGQLGNYAAVATTGTGANWSFWTFCLERSEYFQSGRTYGAEISATNSATNDSDTISMGTAYLYQQFALGNLSTLMSAVAVGSSFDYSDVSNGGVRLQNSIWALEGELDLSFLDSGIMQLLENKFTNSTTYLSDYHGTSVGVLNLTKFDGANGDSMSGTARQDQLFYRGSSQNITTSGVPDGGTTLLMLGLSLGGLQAFRRIQKA